MQVSEKIFEITNKQGVQRSIRGEGLKKSSKSNKRGDVYLALKSKNFASLQKMQRQSSGGVLWKMLP